MTYIPPNGFVGYALQTAAAKLSQTLRGAELTGGRGPSTGTRKRRKKSTSSSSPKRKASSKRSSSKKKTKARLVKGSSAAKAYMAKIRKLRK